MKKYLTILAAALLSLSASADEGMWLPSLIQNRIADMQAKGFKLSAEDIYSVNQASLKDAVVLYGSGCTGEVVSGEGLVLTNHHCGYGAIQRHSSVEHDYLRDGFWAMNRSEELPCPGITVSFLDRMEDVTSIVLKDYREGMSEAQRDSVVRAASARLTDAARKEGKGISARVEGLFYGNQYFLFVYRVYNDIRLVGAPPSSIGKFGGDTDNWMWPRHTGDFSMFRIYAGKDNEPAAYSTENVPYSPKRHFAISTKGVKEGDFTFIYGFPGRTSEYIHSEQVKYISEVSDPEKIAIRTERLKIQKKYMSQSQAVRIQYSSKNAGVSNAWKKWQGEAGGIKKNNVVATKQAYEQKFEQWAKGTEYEGITDKLEALYKELAPYAYALDYSSETAATIEIANMARSIVEGKATNLKGYYKDYYLPIDKECFVAVMVIFDEKVPQDVKPQWYKDQMAAYGSVEAWAEDLFTRSAFTSEEKATKAVEAGREALREDPAYQFCINMAKWADSLRPKFNAINRQIAVANRTYMRGQMAFEPEKAFYPDANLTLRVAYGKVAGYSPADGVWYVPNSTLKGIIEKDNPEIFDYNIPQVLRDVYAEGGHDDQPVCFIATNHTTGGNSGSPVINADGDLIGINFDRVWEGTMSDIAFDPEICRNVSLDVRYLLFVIRNIGHAGHLINEMTLK